MIKLLGSLPLKPVIALSGGVDSMVVADFVSRSRSVECAFFHHGTESSQRALEFLEPYCKQRGWTLHKGQLSNARSVDISPEEHWRRERYSFIDSLKQTVITAHHLDDCVETYLWSMMHGTAKMIPYRRNQVIRPFLLTHKIELINWAHRNSIPWVEDDSNKDLKYTRNYVRHELVPRALHVNPGLHKVVQRFVQVNNNLNSNTYSANDSS